MRKSLPSLACAALIFLVQPSHAQTNANSDDVIRTAIHFLSDRLQKSEGLPTRPIYFDSRVVEYRRMNHPAYKSPITAYNLGAPRSPQRTAKLIQTIGAQPGTFKDLCPPPRDLAECRRSGAVAAFAAGEPVFNGDTATIVIQALWLSFATRRATEEARFQVTLERVGDKWHVKDSRILHLT